jgi:hypothetical protein
MILLRAGNIIGSLNGALCLLYAHSCIPSILCANPQYTVRQSVLFLASFLSVTPQIKDWYRYPVCQWEGYITQDRIYPMHLLHAVCGTGTD